MYKSSYEHFGKLLYGIYKRRVLNALMGTRIRGHSAWSLNRINVEMNLLRSESLKPRFNLTEATLRSRFRRSRHLPVLSRAGQGYMGA